MTESAVAPAGAFEALAGTKEIAKLKLLVTTRCNLACPYCFVKDTGEDMAWDLARRGVDLLLESRGADKLISLFGGEPLLNLPLIERVVPYALEAAAARRKDLTLSIITSGALLKESTLRFFDRNRVHVAVSLAGEREDNDALRFFHSGHGSHEAVVERVRLMLKLLSPDLVGVSFCVFPRSLARLERNFDYLLSLGLRYFNFEIVMGHDPWTLEDVAAFFDGCERIFRRVVDGAGGKDPAFLNSVSWELARARGTRQNGGICPFNYELKLYPDGEMSFSHSVMNLPDRRPFVIGNLRTGELSRYRSCEFQAGGAECAGCQKAYFAPFPVEPGPALAHRVIERLTMPAARFLRRRASRGGRHAAYERLTRRGLF